MIILHVYHVLVQLNCAQDHLSKAALLNRALAQQTAITLVKQTGLWGSNVLV